MKKVISVFLAVLLTVACFAVSVSAAQTGDSGTFSAFCYNVSGLPDISSLIGGESRDVTGNQTAIGNFVTEKGYDIFATQEDFSYHSTLMAALPDYKYSTIDHGGVPVGDGTNIMTKNFKLYNENHITWNSLFGIADNGADALSQKGITYAVIEIAEGVYVDFYNIHADAFSDEGSIAARIDNFRQLEVLINSRTVKRPVIVTGDLNCYFHYDDSEMYKSLIEGCGLRDSWIELHNNGSYTDFNYYIETYGTSWSSSWGRWDSVERFLFMNGDGIELNPVSFEYINVKNSADIGCSDHCAAAAEFSYTVTDASQISSDGLKVTAANPFGEMIRRIKAFFAALVLFINNFDEVLAYIKK